MYNSWYNNKQQQHSDRIRTPPPTDDSALNNQELVTPTGTNYKTGQESKEKQQNVYKIDQQQSNGIVTCNKGKEPPKVPLRTYFWELIRRERLKGRYPWTYVKYIRNLFSDSDINIAAIDMSSEEQSTITDSSPTKSLPDDEQTSKETTKLRSEILKPVDHTQNQEIDKSSTTDSVAQSKSDDHSNITHIIIPIDHTIEAQLKDQAHIYEPIQKPDVEIKINDVPYGKDKEKLKENEDAKENNQPESKDEKPPPLSKIVKENQSMSIEEEKSYLDKKILKTASLEEDYNKWSHLTDHEYEPISAPNSSNGPTTVQSGPPIVKDETEAVNIDDDASSTTSADRKYLRIPLDDEVVVPEDGQDEDAAMTDEGISLEERYLNATPTTIGSKTDGEINTSSQVDSSALEILPLRREDRRQATLAKQESTTSQNFGDRMKSSANKLKTRLRAMRTRETKVTDRPLKENKRPKVKRPKSERPSILERARKFERPKFTIPKLPERPKINLPKMPERSKLKMPDISMPKMPEISMPKMPEISMPKMPERSKLKMPDISMPKMPSFTRKTSKDVPIQESTATVTTTTTESVNISETPKRKRFDFDFRTYPKYLSRQKKSKTVVETTTSGTPSSNQESKSTFLTIPDWVTIPRTKRKKGPVGQRWAHKFKDIKYADESPHRSREDIAVVRASMQTSSDTSDPLIQRIPLRIPMQSSEEKEEELSDENIDQSNILYDDRRKNDIRQISAMEEDISEELKETVEPPAAPVFYEKEDVQVKSSLQSGEATSGESLQPESNQSNIEDRSYQSSERGGVIEEIDSDEFFVREKGLSQDNIDISTYLSAEIREAFQNPVNALSQMTNNIITDFDEYETKVEEDYTKMRESPMLERSGTPPVKTIRRKKKMSIDPPEDLSLNLIKESEQLKGEKEFFTGDEEKIDVDSTKENDETRSSPPSRPARRKASEISGKEPDENAENQVYPPTRPSRSRKSSVASRKTDSLTVIDQNVKQEKPAVPFRRRKSLRSLNIPESTREPYLNKGKNISLQDVRDGYDRQQPPPVPKRRSRSSQSRSTVHSATDDDRQSHGAEFFVSDKEQTPVSTKSATPPGYAKIEKPKDTSTHTQPPPRTKRKRIVETQFFTVPRRLKDEENFPPKRPARTYSTLKHSSREREISANLQENKENIIQDTEYIEIDDEDASTRKLQSGEVIQKMKSRPLPAPPRPPRKTHRTIIANEGILREIQDFTVLLQPEDKTDSAKVSNDSIIKGTLYIGNQVNIITQMEPAVTVQEQEDERLISNEIKQTTVEDKNGKSEIIEKLDEGTEKQDYPEKLLKQAKEGEKVDKKPLLAGITVVEVETSTQTDPLPDDFICEEVIAEPTDRILIPSNRKTITEQISFETQQSATSELPKLDSFESSDIDIPPQKRGILEQQSHDRLSESPPEHYDETYLKECMIRLARSEQSSLISRPITEDEIKATQPAQRPDQTQPTVTPSIALPDTLRVQRLQVSDLDVDRLTVSELMTQKIIVSEIDAMSLKLNEMSSQSGTVTTDEIKLPPDFISNIVNSLQSVTQQTQEPQQSQSVEKRITYYKEESTNTDESLTSYKESEPTVKTDETPSSSQTPQSKSSETVSLEQIMSKAVPYPHIYVLPPSFYSSPSSSTARHQQVDSSTNTTLAPDPEIPSVMDEIPDPSIPNLSAQLLKACHSSISRTIRRVLIELSSHLNTGDEKQDAKTAIIVLIVLLAALILLGFTSRGDTVHHHHWEYFNPPSGDRPA